MADLQEQIEEWAIDAATYKKNISGYLEMRKTLENHFDDSFLETGFEEFDALLEELVELVGDNFRPPFDIMFPESGSRSSVTRKPTADERRVRELMVANRERVLPKLKEVMTAYHELVHYIKAIEPKFRFDKN